MGSPGYGGARIEVGVRGDLGEVLGGVVGGHGEVHIPFLQLDGGAVVQVNNQATAYLSAQLPADPGRGAGTTNHLDTPHDTRVGTAAFGDFIGNVADLQQGGGFLAVGNEGADPARPGEKPVVGELADGPVDGHAGQVQGAGQLVFGRDGLTRLPGASGDEVGQGPLEGEVGREV